MLFLFFFFFSSRRRHTRCSRDWSSDVCSSDLRRAIGHSRAYKLHRGSHPSPAAERCKRHRAAPRRLQNSPLGGFPLSATSRWLAATVACCVVRALPAQSGHPGLDPANLDTTCAPCQDFNRYANGGWLARTTLPPEHASYGSFLELVERNNETLHRIVDRLAAAAPAVPRTTEHKLGAFYASCMDSGAVEQAGAGPLQARLPRLAAIPSSPALVRGNARAPPPGSLAPVGFVGAPDFNKRTTTSDPVSAGWLGLPDP